MKAESVNLFMATNADKFPTVTLATVKKMLDEAPDEKALAVQTVELQSPTTVLIISILIGGLGIDRFMIGDTGMGVLKLLTGGLCGILTIYDWFVIQGKTKEYNFQKLNQVMAY